MSARFQRPPSQGSTWSSLAPETRRRVLWGVALILGGALGPVLASVLACSPTAASLAGPIAATPAPASVLEGPAPPTGGLSMPELDLDWRPPSAVAGDVEALTRALAAHERVGLVIDQGLDSRSTASGLDAVQLAALVGRLAPHAAVRPIHGLSLADVVLEDPPLLPSHGGTGQRISWSLPESLELDADRLREWAELGDPSVLVVGAVGVDSATWRELATGSVGSCEPVSSQLLEGQDQSLRMLEPFLDHADAVLASIYQAELAAIVPELREELAEFQVERERRDFDGPGWERYQCGRQYLEYLRPFAACIAAPTSRVCTATPRLFLQGSARIGSVEPSTYIPTDCPRRLGRDYVEALRAPARSAAEAAGDHFDPRWMQLAERLATLTEVYGALEELCIPARRRFAAADLERLRGEVAAMTSLYRRDEQPPHDARFLANDGDFHVPTLGRVRQLARYDGGTGSASRELIATAHAIREFLRTAPRCTPRPGEAPLLAILIDTATMAPEFLGFYYAEELGCEDLGPLL